MEPEKHVCGLTGKVFDSLEEYLAHTSPVTGFKPTDLEHHGSAGIRIAEAALKRTGSLSKEATIELEEKKETIATDNVDHQLAEVKAGRGPDLA